jgi:sugar phosphate isomerase/epimerase
MRISIAGFSFHGLRGAGMMDAFGYLESVKYRYRLDAADFWNGIIGTTDEEYLKKVKQALDEREMTVANYHADGPHVWEDDPAAREKNYRDALTHLRAAALLGAQTVRIDTGGTLTPITDEQLETLASRYREYAQFGEEHGFVVGPENHWGLSLIADNMEKLAKAVDHPAYGILLHVGHWEDGDEEGGDRRMAKYAVHTHLDARITRTCLQERVKILADAGYQGYWGVEHHSGQNEYVEVAWQLAEVQRALVHAGVK